MTFDTPSRIVTARIHPVSRAMDALLLFIDTTNSIIRNYLALFPEAYTFDLTLLDRRMFTLFYMLLGFVGMFTGLAMIACTDPPISERGLKTFRIAIIGIASGAAVLILAPIGFELTAIALDLFLLYATYRVIRGLYLNLIAMRQFRHVTDQKIDDPGIS